MKIQTGIILFAIFIVTAVVYLAWVGEQLEARLYFPNFNWPF